MELLKVENVSIAYDHERDFAVENVSFSVRDGEYICIVGSNGSGKSTLIKGIAGLIGVSRGSIHRPLPIEGYAYLSQNHMIDKDFPATVAEVVLSGTQKQGKRLPFYTRSNRKTAAQVMAMMGIDEFAGRRIGNLSGGQQQRVLLARAFCRDPKLLLLDEPCAGLDPAMTREFYDILDRLNREKHIAVLMVSHDLEQVRQYAHRVIVMDQTVEFDGTRDEWLKMEGGKKND